MKIVLKELIIKYGHVGLMLSLDSSTLKLISQMDENDAIEYINILDKDFKKESKTENKILFYADI